ncbi:MAG: protein phosphatase 2C domain-containing protein [Sandaracinaceae bacterium]|nr:protein phosphatase 2C domain-containing protein [Sandaracinaceae bacterium]
MSTLNDVEMAAAGVRGRDHARAGRPCQDAWHVERGRAHLVAVVADGCGSAPHSEVGARIGARLFAAAVARGLSRGRSPADAALYEAARARVLRHLALLAGAMGGSRAAAVAECFLFTLVGVALGEETTAVFAVGDGVYAVDGEARLLGPFPGNAPPYLGHALLPGSAGPEVALHAVLPTASVRALLVGTDGAAPLLETPGLDALFGDDRHFTNRDALRRRLHRLAEGKSRIDWGARRVDTEPSVLADDATVVLLRRRTR